jgi:hypothetical protein
LGYTYAPITVRLVVVAVAVVVVVVVHSFYS